MARRIEAVVFDFFGTLVHHAPEPEEPDTAAASPTGTFFRRYAARLARAGYHDVDQSVFVRHIAAFDGIEHDQQSASRDAYEAWVRAAYRVMVIELGVDERDCDATIEALIEVDRSAVVADPHAARLLADLVSGGMKVAVCSNWGWELDGYLAGAGLDRFVAAAITSARVGARKPHPRTYAAATDAIGVEPSRALFVGDSWTADVMGALAAGMAGAVHVDHASSPSHEPMPDGARAHCVRSLGAVADIVAAHYRA